MSEKLFKVWFGEVRPVEYTIIAKDKKVAEAEIGFGIKEVI